jgi:DNA (cytosine-5)-methyltransferase 1
VNLIALAGGWVDNADLSEVHISRLRIVGSESDRFDIKLDDARLVLTRSDQGIRVVSRKRRGESEYPVIDINSRELLEMFEGMSAVRVVMLEEEIHILPLASELRRQERVERTAARMGQGDPLEIGSLSHGGGIMCHAIHAGLYREGWIRGWFCRIRPELLDQGTPMIAGIRHRRLQLMRELAFDRWAMASFQAWTFSKPGSRVLAPVSSAPSASLACLRIIPR